MQIKLGSNLQENKVERNSLYTITYLVKCVKPNVKISLYLNVLQNSSKFSRKLRTITSDDSG